MNVRETPFVGFDHIDARVDDLAAARAMYDVLMPALGLVDIIPADHGVEYYEPPQIGRARRFFGIHLDAKHQANNTRVCFAAGSPAEVDRLAEIARGAGAREIDGPEIPYSDEKYYAVFFNDPSGNPLEIAFRRQHDTALSSVEGSEVIDATAAFAAREAQAEASAGGGHIA